MDKLKMHSPNLTEQNIDKIAELFPTVITESTDDDGNTKRAIDFDLLRQELSDHVVEGPQERYQLDWPGKREALFAASAPIAKTLRPVRGESVDFDTTKNLVIEGDNLEALKLIQESYLGKVKMIFIDPPYNTGRDFVYRDDFSATSADYVESSGQVDGSGSPLVANLETNGRFHSDWLSMIYPRARLARSLLSEDGVLFVTIGDAESSNLRRLLDEVFGESNFVGTLVWQSRTSISGDLEVSPNHNFVLVYSRNRAELAFWGEPLDADDYENRDDDPRGPWKLVPLDANKPGGDTHYEVLNPKTGEAHWPPSGRSWAVNSATMAALVEDGRVKFGLNDDSAPKRKLYLHERLARGDTRTPSSLLLDAGTTKDGSAELSDLFGQKGVFDYPKPSSLLQRLVWYGTAGTPDAVVLDFFAGSGTTGHAVMAANSQDGGARSFVLVQVAEPCPPGSVARSAGFDHVAEITRTRLRLAGVRLREEADAELDVGFRSFKVDTTNMADSLRTPDQLNQDQLGLHAASVKTDRSSEDLLFQVLLDWGLELTMSISVEQVDGHEVFVVEDGALVGCFDNEVSSALVRNIAEREPLRAVFRDSGFASDADRINAEQIFAEVSPSTDVKAI